MSLCDGQIAVEQVRRPFGHQLAEFLGIEAILAAAADAGRHLAKQLFDQRLEVRLDVVEHQVRAHQPHAAVDVVADAAGRDHAPFGRIGRAHAADAEAVAPMNVGHGQAGVLNARQKRDVGHLLGGLIVLDRVDQLVVGEDQAIDAHARLVRFGNPPASVVDALERSVVERLWAWLMT